MEFAGGWLPTAENVNALPDPVRQYVHDLETRCDPAGDVRELAVCRAIVESQEYLISELLQEYLNRNKEEGNEPGDTR